MGYLHIPNTYRAEGQYIFLFKDCYALEKIHGSSAHVRYIHPKFDSQKAALSFFAGGESHERFVRLFNSSYLLDSFAEMGCGEKDITVYGEVYGGKCQGMSDTYGKDLKFVAFDVQIGDSWLSVDKADAVCQKLGLEFVYYTKISTNLADIDAARDADSQQAIRNGIGVGKKMEGVVLRPLIEVTLNNGERVISKHKREEFRETATPRPIVDPTQLKVLEDANAVATEWVTANRMEHVLQKIPNHNISMMQVIIAAMVEDVMREGSGEIVDSKEVRKSIGKRTVEMYKNRLNMALQNVTQ